jgi:hypothetical protein
LWNTSRGEPGGGRFGAEIPGEGGVPVERSGRRREPGGRRRGWRVEGGVLGGVQVGQQGEEVELRIICRRATRRAVD